MSKKNITISDNEGVILHPLTVASQVVMESGGTLDTYLDELDTNINTTIGNKVEEAIETGNFATKDDISDLIPNEATETGAGISRAATQTEVNDGHVDENTPNDMAFVRPETLAGKLSSYSTTTQMNEAIQQGKPQVYVSPAEPTTGNTGDIWIIP